MQSKSIRRHVIALLALLVLLGVAERSQAAQMPQILLYFEPNHGQWDAPGLRYVARAPGYDALFFDSEVELRVKGAARRPLRLSLENATAHSAPQAEAPRAGRSNYLRGRDPAAWITRVPLFGRLRYAQLHDGVDWTFYGDPARLEHDLVVAPGADPRALRLRVRGAEAVALTGEGDLLLKIGGRSLLQRRPVAYQHSGARRQSVEAHYRIEQRSADGVLIAFELGDYDRSRTLVIDPVLELAYSGLIGGAGDDAAYGIAVDGNGSAYVVGETESPDFPGSPGSLEGSSAAFVLKLDPSGNGLVYVTYLDGYSLETLEAVAVDAQGHAYVFGTAGSDDLPVVNAFQPTQNGSLDAWVAKLSPGGDALVYASYLGGSDGDFAGAIQVRADGVAVVAGSTDSDDFPASDPKRPVFSDAFVTAISADGRSLVYSRLLNGISSDEAFALALGPDGHAYVAGDTASEDLPGAVNAYAGADAFVARFDGQGELLWSRYLGGGGETGGDTAYAIAVDATGAAYVAGRTNSNTFPLVNALQGPGPALYSGFVAKLSPDGTTLIYSTYLAGDGTRSDEVLAIAVDERGQAYVAGEVENGGFPLQDSLQAPVGYADGFVAKLSADGSRLIYSTLLGGDDDGSTSLSRSGGAGANVEGINAIALDSSGNAYVAGTTGAKDFPQQGGFGMPGEMHDAFVAKIVALDEPGEGDDPPPGGGGDGGGGGGGGGSIGLACLAPLLIATLLHQAAALLRAAARLRPGVAPR